MKFRQVTLATGQTFDVPQGIQRIDSSSTHGWQVRYQGTKLFSDGEGDPQQSLAKAVKELLARTAAMPPVLTRVNNGPSINKTSDLPAGISGPIVRARPGRALIAELSVLLPRLGLQPKIKSIYIGSQNTYTEARYLAALAKGIELRKAALDSYEQDALKAHRQNIKALKTELSSLRSRG
ncbi:hypothetical protein [Aquabacterium sp.]|uniref:hypothetical protein n=1 Tax=Aquabacterium sp. TaxID=1872578 RepID=UPI003D6C7085